MIPDDRYKKKLKFLEYFKQLPVQKLAAGMIGISENTVTRWKDEDSDFGDQIELAKSKWALKTAKRIKSAEWLLERILRDQFYPPKIEETKTKGPNSLIEWMHNIRFKKDGGSEKADYSDFNKEYKEEIEQEFG